MTIPDLLTRRWLSTLTDEELRLVEKETFLSYFYMNNDRHKRNALLAKWKRVCGEMRRRGLSRLD